MVAEIGSGANRIDTKSSGNENIQRGQYPLCWLGVFNLVARPTAWGWS